MTQAEATSTEPVTNPYRHAVDVGLAFVSGYTGPERDHKSMGMYGAIVGLAEKRVDEGATAPDYFCFTPQEILNAMASGADRDATEAGRRVNRYWGKLEGLQNEWQTNIQDEANHGTQSHLPWISKVASSGRHPSAYQFEAKPIDSQQRPTEFPVPPGGIRYRCERSKPKKQRIFHVGVPMTRWRKGAVLSIGLGFFFLMFLLLFSGLFNFYAGQLTPFAQNLLTIGMVAWIAWILLGPILSTANLRVTMASSLITPIGETEDMQLVAERTENHATVYHLVKFSGECKLCGGRVTVGRGGLAAPGRLVGRCQDSPREHLYTFDHVTRVGMPLRSSRVSENSD